MIAQEDIKIGAKVRFNYKDGDWGDPNAIDGNEYWIVEDSGCEGDNYFTKHTVQSFAVQVNGEDFTLIPIEQTPELELPLRKTVYDIARPILAERKVGKVRMELVDDGFANALFEIAKVMSWASLNKGYKDGDWKSLPDMEKAFKGAASRHRTKHDIQRISDTAPLSCVDEESGLLHKAHEAFNVLAQLEMILTGRIK